MMIDGFLKKFKVSAHSSDNPIISKCCLPVVQILIKKLQMIFQTSDVRISNGNIKGPIGTSASHCKFYAQVFFHVIVAVANIERLNYYL